MKRICTLLTLLIANIYLTQAQIASNSGLNAFFNDMNGAPLKISKGFNVEGSPFLYDEYLFADIVLSDNRKYENIKTKINLETNQLIVLNSKEEEIQVNTPIKEIIFKSSPQNKDTKHIVIRGINNDNAAINAKNTRIVEVLVDGNNYKLYRSHSVSYTEERPYGDAGITRLYQKNISFFAHDLSKPTRIERLGKSKNSILGFFSKKRNELKKYVDAHKINFKTDEELITLFEYANTLN